MPDLIKQAQKGDGEAFIALMEENKQALYKAAKAILVNDEDVADAMQDTVLAAYQNIARLKKPQYFKTWLTRILINKCCSIRKKNLRCISTEVLPEQAETDKDIEAFSGDTLKDLSGNYRLVLNLYYGMGFSVKEIAGMLKLNENTVKTRLFRGREAAKQAYMREKEADVL